MTTQPVDVVNELMDALNKRDVDRALACYESGASLVVQPGQVATGAEALRDALAGFIALNPTLTAQNQHVIQAGDVAQYISRWTLKGRDPDGNEVAMNGESSDVLRRQPNGRWLIALDNPWGAAVLGP